MSGVTESPSPADHPEQHRVPLKRADGRCEQEKIETPEEHDRRIEELRRLLEDMEQKGKLDIK